MEPLAQCVSRLQELIAPRLDRVVVIPGARDADPDALAESRQLFVTEVLPALTEGTSAPLRRAEESPVTP